MSSRGDDPRGQLDIPLVWEQDPTATDARRRERPPAHSPPAELPAGVGRLLLAALADLGALLLALAAAWIAAVAAGAEGDPTQLLLIALAGLEVASVAAVGALWGWRGTLGMLLLDATFNAALPLPTALRVWLVWCICLPVAALPLLVGRAGGRVVERLAGAGIRLRPSPSPS